VVLAVVFVVAPFFETDTDCLFGVSARRPHAGFDYVSTRPQALSLSLFILVVLVIIAESNPILHAPQQYSGEEGVEGIRKRGKNFLLSNLVLKLFTPTYALILVLA
jgi:hypothetical protein